MYSRDEPTQEAVYLIPHFAGMEFAYTEIDAAYVWTHGGYQIARSHDNYPVFIEVHDKDVERWIGFFERYGIDTAVEGRPDISDVEGSIYYVLFSQCDGIGGEWVDGNPVIPLETAVDQMMANRPAYEPALEFIAKKHDVDIDTNHHDELAAD